MTDIRAIETIYKGYRFRSRLEARWAVFFDALGVEYEYEPEGFELGDGMRYLPDFRLKCYGTRGLGGTPFDLYVEVKGNMNEYDAAKIRKFGVHWIDDLAFAPSGDHLAGEPLLIVGNIPEVISEKDIGESYKYHSYEDLNGTGLYPFNYETIDGDNFAAYPGVQDGKFFLYGDDGNYLDGGDKKRLINAYKAARSARFEYGETPR